MFSGIVEELGRIDAIETGEEGSRLTVAAPGVMEDIAIGESISVNGTCLTVTGFDRERHCFNVEAVTETLRKTTLGGLAAGDRVNLEKALRVSDRLGGHIVTGHVDCVAHVSAIKEEGFSRLFTFRLDRKWAPYFVAKGSVTVSGVSLTVVDVKEEEGSFFFSVALIPHTMEVTTLGSLEVGSPVNIETDIIARYVVRLLCEGYMENLNKVGESILERVQDR